MDMLLTLLYGASGMAAALLYLPQIRTYHRDRAARSSISLLTWGGWIGVTGVTVLYACYVIHNPLIALVAALNILAQVTVFWYGIGARIKARPAPCAAPVPIVD